MRYVLRQNKPHLVCMKKHRDLLYIPALEWLAVTPNASQNTSSKKPFLLGLTAHLSSY